MAKFTKNQCNFGLTEIHRTSKVNPDLLNQTIREIQYQCERQFSVLSERITNFEINTKLTDKYLLEIDDRLRILEKMANTTSASINGGLENDLLRAAEADNIGEQMRIVRQISHRRKIDDFHKQITELKEENKKLREEISRFDSVVKDRVRLIEENIKLKQSQNSASNEEINRMIDSTINIMKAWNIQREGAK